MAGKDEQPVDKRILWMEQRIVQSLKIKPVDSKKFIDSDENRLQFTEFLELPDCKHLFVYPLSSGMLVARVDPPEDLKKKGVYFAKLKREKLLDETSLKNYVSVGDLSPDILQTLNVLTKSIFLNLLRDSRNLKQVPDVVVPELMEASHSFLSELLVTLGLSEGRTLLPIPPVQLPARIDEAAYKDKELLYQLESAVVAWTGQIRAAIVSSPEEMIEAATDKHPGPLDEIEFWRVKADNLAGLEEQLYSVKIIKILVILRKAQSQYYASFSGLMAELAQAGKEARDNYRFLKPLREEFEAINVTSSLKVPFTELVNKGIFRRLFHFLYTIWMQSGYYNTAPRLVVLIREMCNDLIECARENVSVSEFADNIEKREAIQRLSQTLSVCGQFKAAYFYYKSKVGKEARPWKFQNTALFSRLDAFLERCHDLLDVMETAILFEKMESMKIGGSVGQDLTTRAEKVKRDFDAAQKAFFSVDYDLLNVDEPRFDSEYSHFRSIVRDLEKQMGSMLVSCIDDARSINAVFKAVDTFDGFTERPVISQEWAKRQNDVLVAFNEDLLVVQDLFHKHREATALDSFPNMPPTATALIWARGLLERIDAQNARVQELSRGTLDSELGVETTRLYGVLSTQIKAHINANYEQWAGQVGQLSTEKLKNPLLVRDEQGRLQVNFDPNLVKTLREVYYLEVLNSFDTTDGHSFTVPQQALSLYGSKEAFRSQVLSLEYICTTYNNFMKSLRDEEEKPLMRQELDQFDLEIQKGMKDIHWHNTQMINAFIEQSLKMVTAIDTVAQTMHGNLKEIQDMMSDFIKEDKLLPLRPSRGDKTMSESDLRKKLEENNRNRKAALTAKGERIHSLISQTLQRVNELKATSGFPLLDSESDVWKRYIEYANSIVRDLICDSVVHSLRNIRDQLNPQWMADNDGVPLVEVKLMLTRPRESTGERPESRYEPAVTTRDGAASIEGIMQEAMQNITGTATCVVRLDGEGTGDDYSADVKDCKEATALVKQVLDFIHSNADACGKFMDNFSEYKPLWEKDMKRTFQQFLSKDEKKTLDENGMPVQTPDEDLEYFGVPLVDYNKAISDYERIGSQVDSIQDRHVEGFIRIDLKPIRHALQDICRRWKETFSGHLMRKIQEDLEYLRTFVSEADRGLETEVLDGNIESLKSVMRWIRDCRKRHVQVVGVEGTKNVGMFPPIQAAIQMLKSHATVGADAEAELARIEVLEDLRKPAPDMWNTLNKKALNVRAVNSLVQDREAEKIKEQQSAFEDKISGVARKFRTHALFGYRLSYLTVYDEIDAQQRYFDGIEGEGRDLQNLQELFDLTPSDFKELRECRHELVMLKHLWDMVTHVNMQFKDWMASTFKSVDIGSFEDELRKLQRQLKGQPLKVKGWECFKGLEEQVKNMTTSLPLCERLSSDAMRERHWQLLLTTTHQTGKIDPKADDFTLERLISLGLHRYADEVVSIVERAEKEKGIEKQLNKIIDIWEKLAFSYDYSEQLDTYLLGQTDDVVEQLETDNNTLSSMLTNRFVDHFFDIVMRWQKNLGMVDTCMTKWVEIQRQWMNLFPIFVMSADIKEQLPEDSRAFQEADEIFRSLMSKAHKYTQVIQVMCSDVMKTQLGRGQELEETLTTIQDILNRCEKSLTEYLETKRKIFPRFFFVSASDLIDILSKGSDPRAVMVHMSKIIDSVDYFSLDGNPNPSAHAKDVHNMISVQGEKVRLKEDFRCDGPVEDWLNGIVEAMQKAVKHHIQDANSTYIEKPRTEWIYAYCCQAVIVASRVWFTTEVHQAFTQLEEGNDMGMKDCLKNQRGQLDNLIKEVLEDRSSNERKMLVHLITIDVHNRDIVQSMVDEKVDAADSFMWQSQLRYYWDEKRGSEIRICDAEFINGYEYIGLCGCLVITKLTDRCYITLTQALRLRKGGAPAGPAGTGKTETTKDLARNLGIACYVFNCSDQMNYITLGQIFKGLAMSGSWGCFDEFNRISIEVLSVVATQVGSILNALKEGKKRFRFMDEEIPIAPSVGTWITMNPGYAGRTELPENIKSLFRPCAMVVPDLKNICEIMLAAEGFVEAKDLALKFVTLYRLNKELLSPQDHYDWGLRAVKSVLYIAGSLKRGDPQTPERNVLMRALRDTNMAKLSKDDVYVFMGLIRALFPNLEVPKKEKPKLVKACKDQCAEMKNLPGENDIFILKCVQYEELLHVRHSVFILGPAGCGKTQLWRCLQGALTRLYSDEWKGKCTASCMNPKAITSNEMYGYFTPNKEWRDGILSSVFRDLALESKKKQNMKWIVLDGIIDAEWIESMNTVMDDNKVLTLVSNDRIPLTSSMRMIFEVSHLKNASPATVSRAGVVYINESDLGWGPFKDKWVASREDEKERTLLDSLFDKYVPQTFDQYKTNSKLRPVVTVVDINIVQTICFLLEGVFKNASQFNRLPQASDIYERYFVFAVIWAFGGPLGSDGRIDARLAFSTWWRKEFAQVKIPDNLTVFDYYIDAQNNYEWRLWSDLVQPYTHDPEAQLSTVTVQTADTVRMTYIMSLFVDNGKGVMLVGTAGTGKTNLIMSKLRALDNQVTLFRVISFNARTSSSGLQSVMEQSLEKRSGKTFGPFNRKKIVFFMDDMNMPAPDKYGTQECIALLQQHVNYGFWYDRIKIIQKEVVDVRYVAAMNPKSGTFTILDRLLRHFAVFSTNMPDRSDLVKIYGQVLMGHLAKFSRDLRETLATTITNVAIELHAAMVKDFLPTAIKFHYQWNMREMFNIFQGMCKSLPKLHNDGMSLVRLFIHECTRTFRDRMPTEEDMKKYDDISLRIFKSAFGDLDATEVFKEPLLWAPFHTTREGDENVYFETDYDVCSRFLASKLSEYNDSFTRMDLVLFNQAMEHVCRIARITSNPRGNALLVGVGGSGKQSLARLASFINGHDIFQIIVTSTYGIYEFRTDMQDIYRKCGLKGIPYSFILTDSQIVSNDMLVYMNDMLSSGNVPELFNQDERDAIIGSCTNEVKVAGLDYTSPDVVWEYFINKVRANLHIILCFSPVGKNFALWCRQFPALANTTVIDWFHRWPEQALRSVATKFLTEVELGGPAMTENIAEFMAFCQENITTTSEEYMAQEKRYCYTTPKSFLELISLYKKFLSSKRRSLLETMDRLETGIKKIQEAGAQVAALQEVLKKEAIEVEDARRKTAQLMEHVGKEKAIVEEQSEIAEVEEAKTNKIVAEVESFAAECAKDLAAAQPLVQEAKAALDSLDKGQISELKNLARPPEDVQLVAIAVKVLTSPPNAIPQIKSRNWGEAKKMMNAVDSFLAQLKAFDCDNIPQPCVDAIQMYINNPSFDAHLIKTKSVAASGLCTWVVGMNRYHIVRCEVRPKEERLAEARSRLDQSKAALKKIQDKVSELRAKLDTLLKQYNDAVDAANTIEAKAKKTRDKADLANRLVSGLSDESVRWGKLITDLNHAMKLLVGDVLLGSAFISYIGPFCKQFREKIITQYWIPRIKENKIPMTPGLDIVMHVLTSEAQVAQWNNEGLPADPVSTENGAIVTNCSRWPLLIDPQLQGIKWIRSREEKNGLRVLQTTQKRWQKALETCIEEGLPCLLEGLGDSIEPILDNVLGRATYKKGGRQYIKVGATEVEYNPKFRFFLQTKLGNPHYKPEVNAQTTLINFMVTETGLEDQLLAVVVNHERPDLEDRRVQLIRQMNSFTIELQRCEDGLLLELSNATGDILENVALVENLENTKRKAKEIGAAMRQAIVTKDDIAHNRLTYTPVAVRGSLLFFQIDQLCKIDHMYQYSLEAFMVVFNKALHKAEQPDDKRDIPKRVDNVLRSITETIFAYVSRGLFERHKLIFSSLLCFAILNRRGDIDRKQLDFLLRGKKKLGVERPEPVAEWCPEANWAAVQALAEVEGATPSFEGLPSDMSEHNRWKLWTETEKPEDEKLPTDWKNLSQFQKLLVLRCLRPDRLTSALETFVADSIGRFFVKDQAVSLNMSYKDATTSTPLFFILSPGVDPVRAVEELGRKQGYTYDNENLYNVSLGQGQEIVADRALETCFSKGGWALLNNIHLVEKWLGSLEQRLESYSEIYAKMAQIAKRKAEKRAARKVLTQQTSQPVQEEQAAESGVPSPQEEPLDAQAAENENHEDEAAVEEAAEEEEDDDDDPELKMDGPKGHQDFRVFLSAEPSNVIPIAILQRSIKLTSEPPSGIQANLIRAMSNFSDEPWEKSAKPSEYRCILFAMCFYHAVVVERKKFGPQGWNRVYPFNLGDLTTCMEVTANYIEDRPKVPWEDLRYVFGEIMYGGHITDDWDRVLCMAYLQQYIQSECLDSYELAPGLTAPQPMSYQEYMTFLTDGTDIPHESPVLYGLHPNAEINFRTVQADVLFRTINELQPKQQAGADMKGPAEIVSEAIREMLERLPEPHNLIDLSERLEDDRTPQQHVFYQECERMNGLFFIIKVTLEELQLGLKGDLSMTTAMQLLQDQLFLNKVPDVWSKASFMSMRPLGSWMDNVSQRNQQLLDWIPEMQTPKVTNLAHFFNPMSFLTAIMQTTSIQNSYDLDQMSLVVDVLKKSADQIDTSARDGAHCFGMIMEGARWDPTGSIEESRMKELYPRMPVMTIRSLPLNKIDRRDQYECPLYKTQQRGPGFVVGLFLKTKYPARRWVIAGVGLLLDVVE